jgi:hypothetical protein
MSTAEWLGKDYALLFFVVFQNKLETKDTQIVVNRRCPERSVDRI